MKFNKYYQDWKAFKVNWKKFNLNHLHSFSIEKIIKWNEVKLFIRFSDHCFTKKKEKILESEKHLIYPYSPKPRLFSNERYKESLKLRNLIEKSFSWRIFFSKREDFIKINTDNNQTLHIYFTAEKTSSKKIIISINSCYFKEYPNKSWITTIEKLLEHVFLNKKLKNPAK